MDPLSLGAILLLLGVGLGAGAFGALAGVGGGAIITPLLALHFGLPMHQAIGVGLVAVIATSTASSSVHVERHLVNVRLGMILELATTTGAAAAAIIAGYLSARWLAGIFIGFLAFSCYNMMKRAWGTRNEQNVAEIPPYTPENYPTGLAASLFAGALSGLLGVGGGVIKVPVMYLFMKVPLRVATATSNFTIGVTAAASAYVYYMRGDVNVLYAAPIVAGVFAGSLGGASVAPKIRSTYILWLFVAITGYMATQMAIKLATGKIQ